MNVLSWKIDYKKIRNSIEFYVFLAFLNKKYQSLVNYIFICGN